MARPQVPRTSRPIVAAAPLAMLLWATLATAVSTDDQRQRLEDRGEITSFAQYGYFSDDEVGPGGDNIWFTTWDLIEGPLHSNGVIRIAGSPQCLGPVTSHSDHMTGYPSYVVTGPGGWPAGDNNPTFAQGFQLNVPLIPLPTQTWGLRAAAQTGGLCLPNASIIELGKNAAGLPAPGWLRYRDTDSPGPWIQVQISALASGVVYCDGPLKVSGILDGELTISSSQNIWILDDLVYRDSDSGTPRPGCDDILGLVAGNNIICADNAANQMNLNVDAVMMALNTSIYAENYDSPPLRGILKVWGGRIQKYRGAVGTFRNGVLYTGYSKDYHYDPRVVTRIPPHFPTLRQAPQGACCDPATAVCAIRSGAECQPPSAWHPEWNLCDPNPCPPSSVDSVERIAVDHFLGAAPNPFAASTTLRFRLAVPELVRLNVFDPSGRRVLALDLGVVTAGIHSLEWDGRGAGAVPLPAGVYYARLTAGGNSWIQTLTRIN